MQSKGAQPLAKEKGRPGVMIYFDISPSLNRLSDCQNGKLFKSILEYGQFGVVPDFGDDLGLCIAWDFIKPAIDRDKEKYEERPRKNAEAANIRWSGRFANAPNDLQIDASDADASFAVQIMPTTSPTTTPTTTATTEIKKKEEKELSMQERKEQMIRQLKAYQE